MDLRAGNERGFLAGGTRKALMGGVGRDRIVGGVDIGGQVGWWRGEQRGKGKGRESGEERKGNVKRWSLRGRGWCGWRREGGRDQGFIEDWNGGLNSLKRYLMEICTAPSRVAHSYQRPNCTEEAKTSTGMPKCWMLCYTFHICDFVVRLGDFFRGQLTCVR